jgi:endo-1,4-beta-D-glucanase Y
MKKIRDFCITNKTVVFISVVLLISAVAHAVNMFHYPYYENDEGTYISQAWSLVKYGKIAPYTYWYDHAPAGWILIALWSLLSGGFFTFGTAINSGRVLMLILHVLNTYLLIVIARKLTGKVWPGVISSLIFSLSPLAIYFQRLVLLDNMMIFWVLLSLALLLRDKFKLRYMYWSAVIFGIAALTKENAVFFIPAFLYVIATVSHKNHRSLALVKWLAVSCSVISFYFLYAILKSELIPQGLFGDKTPHVSLIATLSEQMARGSTYPFWDTRSDFYASFIQWVQADRYFIFGGIVATILCMVLAIKIKRFRFVTIFNLLFLLFLLRGKLVVAFYIIPLIPFWALSIGLLIDGAASLISNVFAASWRFVFRRPVVAKALYYPVMLTTACVLSYVFLTHQIGQYTRDETTPQIQTIAWIKNHLDPKAKIIVDNAIYVDLHEKTATSSKMFPNADWFWKVERDPEVQAEKFDDSWNNVQYIVLSHEILKQMKQYHFTFLKNAFENSYRIADITDGTTSRDINNYYSSNGNWMSIYQVNSKDRISLDESWKFYKTDFIKSYGQVIDPDTGNTTSEGQSYAMLRAVWKNDKKTFDGVWAWTKDHLQYRTDDKLISWLWKRNGDNYELGDSASAADADEDIALALLFASKKWNEPIYFAAGKKIINAMWEKEVIAVDGRYFLTAGTSAKQTDGYLVNPSYFAPASYRIFAEVDTDHPWATLAADSYSILNELGKRNSTYLPSNWVLLDPTTGSLTSAATYMHKDADVYGFDAFRVMWRVALDKQWFASNQATAYLKKVEPFFEAQWNKGNQFASLYDVNGGTSIYYGSISTVAGPLSVLSVNNRTAAKEVYNEIFASKYNAEIGFWGDRNNYYDQNWAWFATALYNNSLANLWKNDAHAASVAKN